MDAKAFICTARDEERVAKSSYRLFKAAWARWDAAKYWIILACARDTSFFYKLDWCLLVNLGIFRSRSSTFQYYVLCSIEGLLLDAWLFLDHCLTCFFTLRISQPWHARLFSVPGNAARPLQAGRQHRPGQGLPRGGRNQDASEGNLQVWRNLVTCKNSPPSSKTPTVTLVSTSCVVQVRRQEPGRGGTVQHHQPGRKVWVFPSPHLFTPTLK